VNLKPLVEIIDEPVASEPAPVLDNPLVG